MIQSQTVDASVGRDGGHHVQVEDRDHKEQNQIAPSKRAYEMRLFGLCRRGQSQWFNGMRSVIVSAASALER